MLAAAFTAVACGDEFGVGDSDTSELIYGVDGRTEYVSLPSQRLKKYGDATAALFGSSVVSCSGTTCNLTNIQSFTTAINLPLCPTVRFRGQGQGAFCSSFLVGPDLFATAGHCLAAFDTSGSDQPCTNVSVVFDFNANGGGTAPASVPNSSVYTCTRKTWAWNNGEDWEKSPGERR